MNSLKSRRVSWILVVLLGLCVTRSVGVAAASASHCGGWRIVSSPNPFPYYNLLNSVTAVAPNDVWAVGFGYPNGGPLQTLIEHWDGTSWQVAPNAVNGLLTSVTAVSASDVWAVGYTGGLTLIEHWNGTHWSIVPSPSVGNYLNYLASVSAVSPRDIWAVGDDEAAPGAVYRTLTEHWDGSQWSLVKSPNVGPYNAVLGGVTAITSTNVWAVGSHGSAKQYFNVPLTEHWDGVRWSIVHAPGVSESGLGAVTATDASHVWAVGSSTGPLIERWNGSRWHMMKSPNLPGGILAGVAAQSTTNSWAVGWYGGAGSQTITEHWDGASWQQVSSPNVPSASNYLEGVAMASAHDVWAVGYVTPPNSYTSTTLIEHYC